RAEQGSLEVAVVRGDRCSLLRRHISCRSPLSTRSAFWRAPSGSTSPVRRNLPQIAPVVSRDEVPAKSALFRARCQLPQRLLKTVNRDDGQPVRVLAGSARIRADRHEEEIHMGAARADRLLPDPPDGEDRAVEGELARRRDPTAVRDVAAELARYLEGEGKTGGRTADLAEVDAHVDRKPYPCVLVDEYPDDRPLHVRRVRHRADGDIERTIVSPDGEVHAVSGRVAADHEAQLIGRAYRPAVDRDDDVVGLEHPRRWDVGRDVRDENTSRDRHDVV